MKLAYGDIWSTLPSTDLLFVTINSTLNSKGELIMGSGAAAEAKARQADLPARFGAKIPHLSRVGLVILEGSTIAGFQTKIHWKNPATLDLIDYSTSQLVTLCQQRPELIVNLNFPGIGRGGLRREDVLPLLTKLPDTVTIWQPR